MPQQFQFLVDFTCAVLLALGAIGANRFRVWWVGRNSSPRALRRSAEIQDVLNQLTFDAHAQRITLLQASNCGGLLDPAEPWNRTILYEACSDRLGSRKAGWTTQPIDGPYRQVLAKALDAEVGHVFRTEDLPRSSMLRTIYETEEIAEGLFAVITHRKNRIWYLSLNHLEPLQGLDADQRHLHVSLALSRLKSLLT